MSLPIRITGIDESLEIKEVSIDDSNELPALLVATRDAKVLTPNTIFFVNPTVGVDMNQNVTFGGTPELINNGGDAVGWTGAIVTGTWDFADATDPITGAASFTITGANNLDQATFDDATETDMSGFTAITGKVRLDIYSGLNNNIELQFTNNGLDVGNTVDLNDFIDTGNIGNDQSFAISKDQFGLATQTVDQLMMTILRSGGTKPNITFDDFQIEETGAPLQFRVTADPGTFYHISEFNLFFADALAGTVTDGTMPGLSYNQLLGVSNLPIGVTILTQDTGELFFAGLFQGLNDLLVVGADVTSLGSDGTNTFIKVTRKFDPPIILKGSFGDFTSFTINDNLSGLLQFRATVTVGIEDRGKL